MPDFTYLYARLMYCRQRLISLGRYELADRILEEWTLWRERMEAIAEREADYHYTRTSR